MLKRLHGLALGCSPGSPGPGSAPGPYVRRTVGCSRAGTSTRLLIGPRDYTLRLLLQVSIGGGGGNCCLLPYHVGLGLDLCTLRPTLQLGASPLHHTPICICSCNPCLMWLSKNKNLFLALLQWKIADDKRPLVISLPYWARATATRYEPVM